MTDNNKLHCSNCGGSLALRVSYDGCDWESVKGERSGFKHEISLDCDNCGRIFPIGRLNSESAFCENLEPRRPYGAGPAEPQTKSPAAHIVNDNFLSLTAAEFDKTIVGLSGLSLILAPILIQNNLDGRGAEDAAEISLDLQIGADAVTEIKQQIFGREVEA